MKARLLTNFITGGKSIARDSIIDDGQVPEHLRKTILAYDLKDRGGKVMVLHDLAFQSIPKPDSSGTPTSYPVSVSAGELLNLDSVPPFHRASLKEGSDYVTQWTNQEQKELLRAGEETYAQQFESEPAAPRGVVLR